MRTIKCEFFITLTSFLAIISSVVAKAEECAPATFPNLADAATSGLFKVVNLPCSANTRYQVILTDRNGCPAQKADGVFGLNVAESFNAPMLVSLPAPAISNSQATTDTFKCQLGSVDIMVSLKDEKLASNFGVTLKQIP